MKRTTLAAVLTATTLAFGIAHADEVMSGVQNPGNFADVAQGASKFVADRNASGFSGLRNPGSFAPVEQTGVAQAPRGNDEILSGVQNSVAPSTHSVAQGRTRSGS